MAAEATIFPQAIGVASTWEPGARRRPRRRRARRRCARSAPTRACRPCSTSAAIHGGDAPRRRSAKTRTWSPAWGWPSWAGSKAPTSPRASIATAKHFVGYGASEGGLNWAPPHLAPRELRDVYLHPFEAAVRCAGLRSVMNAYNELDGVPAGADRGLLTGTLRDQWGFDGCVVVGLLLDPPARRLPPTRRRRRGGRGVGARRRPRRRAARHRLLRRCRCSQAVRSGRVDEADRRHRGRPAC